MDGSLILGIDAGSSRTVAVLAELADNRPQVIGVGVKPCVGVRKGVVVDLESAAVAVRQAVSEACQMAGRSDATRAVVGVSGTHILSIVGSAEVPVQRPARGIGPADVRRALDLAANIEMPAGREVIHVVPRSYAVDGNEGAMDPLGLSGRRLQARAHLVTGDSLRVQNGLRAAMRAGLQVGDYQVGIRAAGQAVLTPAECESGVLLLDIGAGTTGLAVYDHGHLFHLAVLPLGGEQITEALVTDLQVPLAVAEELKTKRGWAAVDLCPDAPFELVTPSGQRIRELTDRQLAETISPRVQELLGQVALEVKRSGYKGLFPAGLVLTGGGSRLQGLVSVAADSLGLSVRVGIPTDPLVCEPEYATAAGLVHWGARLAEDEAAVAAEAKSRDRWSAVTRWMKGLFR